MVLLEFMRISSVVRELLVLNSVRAMNFACALRICLGLSSFLAADELTGIFLSVRSKLLLMLLLVTMV